MAKAKYEIRVRVGERSGFWNVYDETGRCCQRITKAAACRASARRFSKATGIRIVD